MRSTWCSAYNRRVLNEKKKILKKQNTFCEGHRRCMFLMLNLRVIVNMFTAIVDPHLGHMTSSVGHVISVLPIYVFIGVSYIRTTVCLHDCGDVKLHLYWGRDLDFLKTEVRWRHLWSRGPVSGLTTALTNLSAVWWPVSSWPLTEPSLEFGACLLLVCLKFILHYFHLLRTCWNAGTCTAAAVYVIWQS